MVIFVASIVALLWALILQADGLSQAGWTSLMASIWMIGGIQLLSLGIIGEYIGKVYNEAKARPRYINRARTQRLIFLPKHLTPRIDCVIIVHVVKRSHGSVGRAHRSHRWGHRFESCCDHHQTLESKA